MDVGGVRRSHRAGSPWRGAGARTGARARRRSGSGARRIHLPAGSRPPWRRRGRRPRSRMSRSLWSSFPFSALMRRASAHLHSVDPDAVLTPARRNRGHRRKECAAAIRKPDMSAAATVERVAVRSPASTMSQHSEAPSLPGPDAESRAWLFDLRGGGDRRDEATRELFEVLLRAARFEINRRRGSHPHLRGGDLDDLAHQAADDALLAILGKLDTYRGESRFTTWAYKFALLEAAVKLRRRAWQGREVPIEPEHWSVLAGQRRVSVRRGRKQRTARRALSGDRDRAFSAAARGTRRSRTQRRSDRRARRAAEHDARRSLQDDP